MMPRLDGFGLLRKLRADPAMKTIPVILLSARAGEESCVEGLERGADDYLIKPFSARELLARVDGHLKIARTRQEAREALARQARELSDANRAKDEFLAMLGHELRNPLSPIVTALELLRMRGAHSREMEIIQRQVAHTSRLLDDLLNVSRIARDKITLHPIRLDLARLVRDTCADFRSEAETAGLTLSVETPEPPLWIDGDPTRLRSLSARFAGSLYPGQTIRTSAWRDGDLVTLAATCPERGETPVLTHAAATVRS